MDWESLVDNAALAFALPFLVNLLNIHTFNKHAVFLGERAQNLPGLSFVLAGENRDAVSFFYVHTMSFTKTFKVIRLQGP